MTIIFEGEEYLLPSTLADITLGKHIDWSDAHGKALGALKLAADQESDEDERNLQLTLWYMQQAYRSVFYYAALPGSFSDFLEMTRARDVLPLYKTSALTLALEESEIIVEDSYPWDGHLWKIQAPTVLDGVEAIADGAIEEGDLSHDRYLVLIDMAEAMLSFSDGDMAGLLPLAAFYILRDDETAASPERWTRYTDAAYLEYLRTMPLDIVMAMAVYLKAGVQIYAASLNRHIQREAEVASDGDE